MAVTNTGGDQLGVVGSLFYFMALEDLVHDQLVLLSWAKQHIRGKALDNFLGEKKK